VRRTPEGAGEQASDVDRRCSGSRRLGRFRGQTGGDYNGERQVWVCRGVGVQEDLTPPPAVQQDPGQCPDGERERAAIVLLPSTPEQREQALLASERVTAALGDEVLGAFLAVRRSDAEWAADRTLEEVVTGHLWRY
jgi:hypothetical protein